MENIIIIGILAVVVIYAVYKTVKHFKGEGGCCGGGSNYKPKKKKLSNVVMKKTFIIEGMHCEHCKRRVEEVINDIQGVSGSVNLKNNEAVIFYESKVADDIIKNKIERAGYKIIKIK